MPNTIELERTYLASGLPEGLDSCENKEILDIYLPGSSRHPTLRIRKNGGKYEMTKKEPVNEGDKSQQLEQTIPLTEEEFGDLSSVEGKRISKTRYVYDYKGHTAEIDIFNGGLKGLVLVDFEFKDEKEKDAFATPDFCLCEVTQEEFIAGGMLCGKRYEDIEADLSKFSYKRL